MEAKLWSRKMLDRNGILYPMLVIAAVSVIIFSMLGIALMIGLLPRAESMVLPHEMTQSQARVASNASKGCGNCGMGETISAVELKSPASILGKVAGGVTGALSDNQRGRGDANALATVVATGGAYAGNEID